MERRAYPRHPLHLDAAITVGGSSSQACKIRDFCPGGMFLTPLEREAQSSFTNFASVRKGDATTIDFSVPIGSELRHFRLQASVVRAFEGGVGVAFSNPDRAALRVLEGLSRLAAEFEPSKGAIDGESLAALCQDVLTTRLLPLLQSFFERINDRLLLAAREASNNLDQSSHFDAITELERLKGLLERTFTDGFLEGFKHLGSGQCANEQELEDACPAELSLLDKEDLEDLLTIGEIIAKAEPRYHGPLTELEERFSAGAKVAVDKANNPVAPAAVCHVFRGALRESDIAPRVMQLIYSVFDECVVAKLGGVYDELNTVLAEKGVSPIPRPRHGGLEPASTGALPASVQTAPQHSQLPADVGGPTLPALNTDQAAANAPGLSLPAPASVCSADLAFEPAGIAAGAPAPLSTAQPTNRRGGTTARRGEQTEACTYRPAANQSGVSSQNPGYATARTLLQLARGLMGQDLDGEAQSSVLGEPTMLFPSSSGAAGAVGDPANAPADTEAVSHPERRPLSHSCLRDQLLASLQARRQSGERVALPEQRLDDIDFLDHILSTIVDDPLVGEHAKDWIRRLAIPLGQTTIMDEKFLSSQSHPANQVINQVAQIKPDLLAEDGKDGKEIVAEINRIIAQLAGEQPPDVRTFAAVQGQLAAVLEKQNELYEANVAQVIKAREEQQAFVKARQKSAEQPGLRARKNTRPISEEWLGWLTQAKRLNVGDAVMLDTGSGDPKRGTLVWIGDGHNPCVFVDDLGKKLATLSLQELAMQLHRGNLSIAATSHGPVVDRAVYANLRKIHERIAYHATHDPLTGLLNPKEFRRHLGQLMATAGDEHRPSILHWLRLHVPAPIESKEAHLIRDALLRGIAKVLRQTLSTKAVLARTGDDELGLLHQDCDERDGGRITEELRRMVAQYHVTWHGQELVASADVDFIPITTSNHTVAGLLAEARARCLAATDNSEGSAQSNKTHSAELLCQRDDGQQPIDVEQAVTESRLRITYQRIEPVGNVATDRPHYQVVLCLADDNGNLLPVNDKGGAAFQDKQRPVLDRQIIAQVFRWMATHKDALRGLGSMAISLSAQSLADESLTDYLMGQFTESKVPPGKVCFEITEASLVASLARASRLIRTIKEFGCRFALDDFGRADASYSLMRELPFSYIKIDGIFVEDIMESSSDFAVVKSINEIGHFMGKKTVAKNVQTQEVLQRVREIGVDYAQGHWIESTNREDDTVLNTWNEPIAKLALIH